VITQDTDNDLALLQIPAPSPDIAPSGMAGGCVKGDAIQAIGFPLRGLLASLANLTVGTVSALAGVSDDSRYLQITAPVQPGNSGGPLLDMSGNVVGVVVGKLDAVKIARATGDIPQDVNFALHASVARHS
jgi:S1-C subfamily serine protease